MICVSLSASTNDEMIALLKQASTQPADIHELRLDCFKEAPAVEALVAASSRPVLATCRSRQTGGKFDGDARDRQAMLIRAAEAGVSYIDAEVPDVAAVAPHKREAILIAGIQDLQKTPEKLGPLMHDLATLPADWIKFATAVRRPIDNIRILEAIASSPKPCVGIGMGEAGLMTRILGPAFGSRISFGSLERGHECAPGQPTIRDLAELYRINDINEETGVYGLLGNPVAHYRSYRLFNQGFNELQLNAVFIPFLAENAEAFLECIPKCINLLGLSVITPHKQTALAWANTSSEIAKRIGSANTLTLRDTGWHADNTDCLALFEAMKGLANAAGTNLTGAPALLLGSGSTARSVGVALTLLGCRVTVAARKSANARRLADEMDWDVYEMNELGHGDWQVVANATPIGMSPDEDSTPFPGEFWRRGMFAFDAVRHPRLTRFIREARGAGAQVLDLDELLFQIAIAQFKLWTGLEMPDAAWIDEYKRGATSSTRRIYGRQRE